MRYRRYYSSCSKLIQALCGCPCYIIAHQITTTDQNSPSTFSIATMAGIVGMAVGVIAMTVAQKVRRVDRYESLYYTVLIYSNSMSLYATQDTAVLALPVLLC
jgi:hypothetical protein